MSEMPFRPAWPHAPPHWKLGAGTYFVTAGTYRKEHYFGSRSRLAFLTENLLRLAGEASWELQAWAVFSNHYHFVARCPEDADSLAVWLKRLHGATSRWVNTRDGVVGRKVWHNYRETRLTIPKSYYARLAYVHRNAVRHGLVHHPEDYRWCSAGWFVRSATAAQVRTIYSFKTDKVNVEDDYEVLGARFEGET